ncbi:MULTISPECIES: YggS family pyridoxal phosphate-dependent enzyme [Carnobacterium]|uniref:YggS family pyridoxal phosphate-dependent enzyme n=1 Tax=Carnobacterium TaxID=2747 RepID=UPI000D40A821|nr:MULTISPECIES: YggS family pyridoxal phosphate-dependent enzyme [Carnobacterium]MCO6017408.1 YggS family pyridoxal phosphate-dependent enzyme [Carnobacterium divergens]MDT1939178.1 YggS family pyridoxal phosphate-dependent enzyme [Carnobacterium divergens]MDT1941616.1 YggS family pyridoxal phosphate-dependent enzyme [Carnobacterium divergens]MDT1947414.1 YggS family pyridoxal phosphate-dependent enzyme [Carnobacterium divergens]MDT1949853.1 YggS family pyridoxal phosphate-dependent enzyme [C
MSIATNLEAVESTLCQAIDKVGRKRSNVTLIAVTKAVSNEATKEIYDLGIRHLAENRPEGLQAKKTYLPDTDIKWHYIGNLQTRKVKQVINEIDYFHALDRISLAKEIEKRAEHTINCFLEVNVTGEESKHGINPSEIEAFIDSLQDYSKIKIIGLMTMAPIDADEATIHKAFSTLYQLKEKIQAKGISYAPCTELSMGMSNDYQIAAEEGATFVRVGTALFKD